MLLNETVLLIEKTVVAMVFSFQFDLWNVGRKSVE